MWQSPEQRNIQSIIGLIASDASYQRSDQAVPEQVLATFLDSAVGEEYLIPKKLVEKAGILFEEANGGSIIKLPE